MKIKKMFCITLLAPLIVCCTGIAQRELVKEPGPTRSAIHKKIDKIESENKIIKDNSYIDCWSNGRGKFLEITKSELRYEVLPKSLRYKEIKTLDDGRVVLLLQEKDETNYIQAYISITFVSDEEIFLQNFVSYSDLAEEKNGGEDRWFRTDCDLAP